MQNIISDHIGRLSTNAFKPNTSTRWTLQFPKHVGFYPSHTTP